ncbi:hypothetical protein L6164_035026 [Bauhinia variegata]|uniref:Uncharacterized protein n=1 Tax=Bauhinia variegata TaxID=167791 RepID=A0ACB9KX00_BAUVA|nr:hypothetical protein L6164_035026 [Bauhinia variegata]
MKSVSPSSPDISDDCMEDTFNMQSIPPSSPDISDIVLAPQLIPRVGDEYQVEIPPMITESERLQLLKNPADSEVVHDISHSFLMGLPVPVIWVHNEVVDGGYKSKSKIIEPSEASNGIKNSMSDNVIESRPTTSQTVMTGETKTGQEGKNKKYGVVRGTLSNSWSDADIKSFVLGLFVFGKSFIQIKRFMENKETGEILSFYYGEFYKSEEHRRWSDCRKIKGRKCTIGQKLFTGWRQHELLSRLIPHVSEESQNTLLQVSKAYVDGRASLEEYVSSLKSTVGLGVLVEAVGIGKEKEDLTSLAVEPGKNSHMFSISPSIPSGKAWSSLGPGDIINLLTGGFRLSKAKSNDLFWEAVWPRLLARGWHSEQPHGQNYASSKDYLVFLIPGVKKFSRRKLVKGVQYFDSVNDVLSKVVSEPNLLELEVEGTKVGSCIEEDRWSTEAGSNKCDQSDHQGHCYLKPRVGSYQTDHMKFTIVDTSLVHGEKSSHLRQLKSLPLGLKLTSKQTNPWGGKVSCSSQNAVGNFEVDAGGSTYKGDKHISKANHRKDVFDSTNQKLIKITVVDTSLLHGGKLSKVKELRYPSVEMKLTSKMSGLSRESDGSSSDDSSESTMTLDGKKNINNAVCHQGLLDRDAINQNVADDNQDNNANKTAERHQNEKVDVSDDDKQLNRTIKQFKRRARSGHSNHAAPPIKRRRLTACAKAETSRILENSSAGLGSEKSRLLQSSNFPDDNSNVSHPVNHQENVCFNTSAEETKEEDNKGSILNKNCPSIGMPCGEFKKCESQPTTPLNLPQVSPKSEYGEMAEEDGQCLKLNDPCAQEIVPEAPSNSGDVCCTEQQPGINPRRQSRRNRPLTVRALESLANEFLHVQRRPKKKDVQTLKDPFSPCRRARSRVKTTLHRHTSGGGAAIPVEEKHLNGDCNAKENISRRPDQVEE